MSGLTRFMLVLAGTACLFFLIDGIRFLLRLLT
jgi:hypothetical protein